MKYVVTHTIYEGAEDYMIEFSALGIKGIGYGNTKKEAHGDLCCVIIPKCVEAKKQLKRCEAALRELEKLTP